MNLSTITEKQIRTFAGEPIFERGAAYFHEGSVHEFDYFPNEGRIEATVEGNYDNYLVDIKDGDEFSASCDCPYSGYPCKHVVAVLLYFIEQRGSKSQKGKVTKKSGFSLKKSLLNLEREELVELLLEEAAKSKEMKLRLEVRFRGGDEELVERMKKEINDLFPRTQRGIQHFSEGQTARTIRKMIKNFNDLSPTAQTDLYWEIVDCSLYILNEYGMSSTPLESLVMDGLNKLIGLMQDHDLPDKRQMIIRSLLYYYEKGNFALTGEVLDAAELIAQLKSDYEPILALLREKIQKPLYSYRTKDVERLEKLYKKAPER